MSNESVTARFALYGVIVPTGLREKTEVESATIVYDQRLFANLRA
jgi:hypothetical protein